MIPKKYNKLIYEGYTDLLNMGVPKTHIAEILNERWGTEFPESSMRNRFEREQIGSYQGGIEEADYQEKLFTIARQELRLKEQRKVLNKQRGMVDAIAREYAEQGAVRQAIVDMYGECVGDDVERLDLVSVDDTAEVPIYAYGDVHWGYSIDLNGVVYNDDEARARMAYIYSWIVQDAKAKGYKQITIADMGDQIEGSSLRISQLLRITEVMTAQADGYSKELVKLLKLISKELSDVKINFLIISEDNHSQLRTFNTKRDELPDSMALLIANRVADFFSGMQEEGLYENLIVTAGKEIVLEIDGYNVLFAHGHQYGRKEDILVRGQQRHGVPIHLYVGAHFHQYSLKYKNVDAGGQQALVFIPSVVGDTDFSEKLFLSCYPGFVKLDIDIDNKISNSKLIRLS